MSLRAVFAKQSPRRPGDCFISFAMTHYHVAASGFCDVVSSQAGGLLHFIRNDTPCDYAVYFTKTGRYTAIMQYRKNRYNKSLTE